MHELMNTKIPEQIKSDFITGYCLFNMFIGRYASPEEKERAYRELAALFCIDNEPWLDRVYALLSSKIIAGASDEVSYKRLSRVLSFYPDSFTPEERYLTAHLGCAAEIYGSVFSESTNRTLSQALLTVEEVASCGHTGCLMLLAFIEQNGILIKKNTESALSHIRALASWNNVYGILMGMRYGGHADKKRCTSLLCAALGSSAQTESLEYLRAHLPIPADCTADKVALALGTAFSRRTLERHVISENICSVINSPVISDGTKAALLLSKHGEGSLDTLPLSITRSTPFAPIFELRGTKLIDRPGEREEILNNLAMLDVRSKVKYRPLLLVCEDEFVLDEYKKILTEAFSERPIGRIDTSDPAKAYLSHGKNNSTVRTLNALGDASSVIFFENCEAIGKADAQDFSQLLKVDYLKNYHVMGDLTVLDLSNMLPVLFARSLPHAPIAAMCDTVRLEPMSDSELRPIVDDIISEKVRDFALKSVSISDEAYAVFKGCRAEEIENMIERAISIERRTGDVIVLTEKSFEEESGGCVSVGFWEGVYDANR